MRAGARSASLDLVEAWALRLCPAWWLRRLVGRQRAGGGRPSRAQLGRLGEALAERDARRRGWRFVARGVPGPPAQIDLLFREGRCLHVIEVKTRRSPLDRRLELPSSDWIGAAQEQRLRAAARAWGAAPGAARLHLVEVQLVGPGWQPHLRWRSLDRR
jgi:Holliday junction resolvase-like predicted endonuclease